MKVIIVEDEPRVRKGLSEAVEWEKFGMSLVGIAANGMEGMGLFRDKIPDLVITDIRMPIMDGLAMSEAILEERPGTKIMIISGHDEFQYAQKCIALGVENYLLKPIGKKELQAELEKISSEWKSEKHLRIQAIDFEANLNIHLNSLRSVFLEEWLGGTGKKTKKELEDNFSFLKIPLDFDLPVTVAIFELDLLSDETHNHKDHRLLEFALHNLLEEMLRNNGIAYQRGNGQTAVLFQAVSSDIIEDLLFWAERTKSKADELLQRDITVALGSSFIPVQELPHMFQEVQQILRLKLTLGTGVILQEDMIRPIHEQLPVLNESQEALLIHGIEMNDMSEINRLLDEHFKKWSGNPDLSFAEEISFQLMSLFTKLVHKLGKSVQEYITGKDWQLWVQPSQFRSVDEIKKWWVKRYSDLSDSYEGFRTDRKSKLINQVVQYVEGHIYENITRDGAADHVYINSSYLSRLFKEVTGDSFSNFVLNKKMEKAIHLLQVERVMVYEVADRLGYKDPSYFARVFKRHTGKSPSAFQ